MLVGANALEPLEHLVALDGEAAAVAEPLGQQRAPDRVRVQHRAGAARANDLDVQERFGRRARRPGADRRAALVHLEDLVRRELALERRARRDRQPQRVPIDDDAEVAARAQHPAPLVETAAGRTSCSAAAESARDLPC